MAHNTAHAKYELRGACSVGGRPILHEAESAPKSKSATQHAERSTESFAYYTGGARSLAARTGRSCSSSLLTTLIVWIKPSLGLSSTIAETAACEEKWEAAC